MKTHTRHLVLAGLLLAIGSAFAAEPSQATGDHPAVTVARTGAHPSYQDAMKFYGHPARGTSHDSASEQHVLEDHPAVTVSKTGAHPAYQDGMKVYLHPARGDSIAASPTQSKTN